MPRTARRDIGISRPAPSVRPSAPSVSPSLHLIRSSPSCPDMFCVRHPRLPICPSVRPSVCPLVCRSVRPAWENNVTLYKLGSLRYLAVTRCTKPRASLFMCSCLAAFLLARHTSIHHSWKPRSARGPQLPSVALAEQYTPGVATRGQFPAPATGLSPVTRRLAVSHVSREAMASVPRRTSHSSHATKFMQYSWHRHKSDLEANRSTKCEWSLSGSTTPSAMQRDNQAILRPSPYTGMRPRISTQKQPAAQIRPRISCGRAVLSGDFPMMHTK